MEKKRILLTAPPNSIHTQRFIDYFYKQGKYDIHVISINQKWEKDIIKKYKQVRFISFMPAKYYPYKIFLLFTAIKIHLLINRIKPHIIYVHFITPYSLFSLLSKYPKILILWGSDINNYYKKSKGIWKYLYNKSIQKADYILSSGDKYMINNIDNVPNNKWIFWTWGINISIPKDNILREKYKISKNDIVIFSFRTARPIFHIETIIESFRILKKKYNNIKLFIKYKKDLNPEYNQRIFNLSENDDNIIMLPFSNIEKMLKEISMSNIGISLAEMDATPVSVRECMAMGIPVIAYNLPQIKELLDNNRGITIDKYHDPQLLAEKISLLIENKDLYKTISKNAREYAINYFSEEKQWKRLEEIHQRFIR